MKDEVNCPPYISLFVSGELEKRAERLNRRLEKCDICPRKCGVNRLRGESGYCNSGKKPVVASFCDHHGEEPVISGTRGSGTIFFGNFNLACVYCQNYQISQDPVTQQDNQVTIEQLAGYMLKLQDMGCHNINLVSPSHFVAQIVSAVFAAVKKGLVLPLVYNTNSYDSLETLKEMENVISVYLADIKYSRDDLAFKYSGAGGYVESSRGAILEMYRQTGGLLLNDQGLAIKGVLIRHLVLPEGIAGSRESIEWLAENTGKDIGLSLMSQYHPSFRAYKYPELARPINRKEYLGVLKLAKQLGFHQIFAQQLLSNKLYLPDFNSSRPFGV